MEKHFIVKTMYRIKKEFQTIFNPNLIEKYQTAEQWEEIGVHKNTIEEVPNVFVTSGHYINNGVWPGQEITGSKFFFTIHFPSLNNDQDIPLNVIDQMTLSCQDILNNHINPQNQLDLKALLKLLQEIDGRFFLVLSDSISKTNHDKIIQLRKEINIFINKLS